MKKCSLLRYLSAFVSTGTVPKREMFTSLFVKSKVYQGTGNVVFVFSDGHFLRLSRDEYYAIKYEE